MVEHRKSGLAASAGDVRQQCIWSQAQMGLVYPSPYAIFAGYFRAEGKTITKEKVSSVMKAILKAFPAKPKQLTSATVALDFGLFQSWGGKAPKGMDYLYPEEVTDDSGNVRTTSEVFSQTNKFQDSACDIWFHIKSDQSLEKCREVQAIIELTLGGVVKKTKNVQEAASKTPSGGKGKVLGCRFAENLNNPSDPVTLATRTLVGHEDTDHYGGSFVVAQRFTINWNHIHNMNDEEIEDIIGRTVGPNYILPSNDTRAHIKCARGRDAQGNTTPVLRLGLPFGRRFSPTDLRNDPDLALKGANLADEEGIYFAGYTQGVQNLEVIMKQMIGEKEGFMRDRLFDNLQSDFGGYFYVPSYKDLGMDSLSFAHTEKVKNWDEHPGMDWKRLNTHYDKASKNGWMHYNHFEYLNTMSTMSEVEAKKKDPPSSRVLELLSHNFSIWQDNWYFNRKQPEFKHMRVYITEAFGAAEATKVMRLSVIERKAWAIRMTLRVCASHEYGHRGTTWIEGGVEKSTNPPTEGANTYTLHPSEVIVGQLPNLSLGQGRYAMVFERENEHLTNYMSGCNEASGLGHVVPGHQKLLDMGIGGLKKQAEDKIKDSINVSDETTQFLNSVIISLDALSEYCEAFALLAEEVEKSLSDGQIAEKENLSDISSRLRNIATEKPSSFLEALQLLFIMHCALHLNGEPVAIGRLDQMLYPFYKKDFDQGFIDEPTAQEALDCFWIKLDEKVQQNRLNVEDHQKMGYLMPGPPGGTYPKASVNQWVQQITVGGYVADDADVPTPSYNTITKLAIRCSRRLPLNAPCLSLRVNSNTPDYILEEAAKAVLSGGAHPFFIHDDKIIKGLLETGKDIGPSEQRLNALYDGKVRLQDARDYACDGCYEPLFSGKNYFTLPTMQLLEVFEAVLNGSKKYSQAGPNFLRGGIVTEPVPEASNLETFESLKQSFFEQMKLVNMRMTDNILNGFGARESGCPTPLLSAIMDDCIGKGRDLYNGGGQYNLVSLCITGIPTWINAMYSIKKMVYDQESAVTSLPELVECLICDWGHNMVEPFHSALLGKGRTEARAERWKRLREIADALPKFGRGNPEVDKLAQELIGKLCDIVLNSYRKPALASTKDSINRLTEKFGTEENPFGGFQVQVGCATFENYVGFGIGAGASAEGRRNNQTLSSDLSPSPSLVDKPVDHQACSFVDALQGYTSTDIDKLTQGAMTDFNIEESFPLEDLVQVLRKFSEGLGPNMMTITTADPATFEDACTDPEGYDLLRVRMGGWTEFFTSLNPDNQEQHRRRPLSTPSGASTSHLKAKRKTNAAMVEHVVESSVVLQAAVEPEDKVLKALERTTEALMLSAKTADTLNAKITELEETAKEDKKKTKKKKKKTLSSSTKKTGAEPKKPLGSSRK